MKKATLFALLILIGSAAYADPDFVANHYIGQSTTKLSEKYGKAFEKFDCGENTVSSCAAKGIKCECRAVRLIAEPTYGRTLITTISNQKVIAYSDVYAAGPNINLGKLLPTVRSFFGDDKPTEMYDLNTGGDRYQGQFLVWKFSTGAAQAIVFCPMETVAGVKKVDSKVRDCLLKDARILTHKSVDVPKEAKNKSKLEY